ncbi:MAG: hypothetical protein H0Z19_11715 [Archaeoglobus sp.]|uniref:hypothetical protein n=1 Tax=Archaeoglobus sp. TaxID=1872626 RepID=UPI001D6564C2|nr:hypothetical protein [Archaeoglobus sp.]MBO8181115.1 hypothetical protein [Archaeoglobus sp.]
MIDFDDRDLAIIAATFLGAIMVVTLHDQALSLVEKIIIGIFAIAGTKIKRNKEGGGY